MVVGTRLSFWRYLTKQIHCSLQRCRLGGPWGKDGDVTRKAAVTRGPHEGNANSFIIRDFLIDEQSTRGRENAYLCLIMEQLVLSEPQTRQGIDGMAITYRKPPH